MACPKKLRGLCAYTTVKVVKIDDLCLGVLHYSLMFAIFLYIVVYQMIYQLAYISFETPVGTVRMSLQGPTQLTGAGVPCDPADFGCEYDFTDVKDLPYCLQNSSSYAHQTNYECRDWDAFNVVFPVTGGSPFFIASRVTEAKQSLVCSSPEAGKPCKQTYAFGCNGTFTPGDCGKTGFSEETFWLADVERFTMLVDHSVRSPTVARLEADALQMNGNFVDCHGNVVPLDKTDQGQDFITVEQLLSSASNGDKCGVSLFDASSPGAGGTGNPKSYSRRYNGLILLLNIEYENTVNWQGVQDTISYTYRTELIAGTKSKVTDTIFVNYPTQRVTRNQHGIKVVVLQSGRLGTVSFITLMLQLTTSLGLMALSTTAVDVMAVRILPYRRAYQSAKIDEVDVSDAGEALLVNPKVRRGQEEADPFGYRSGTSGYGSMSTRE